MAVVRGLSLDPAFTVYEEEGTRAHQLRMSRLSLQVVEACFVQEIIQVLLGANARSDQGTCPWTVCVLYCRLVGSSPFFFLSFYSSPFIFYFPAPSWVLPQPLCYRLEDVPLLGPWITLLFTLPMHLSQLEQCNDSSTEDYHFFPTPVSPRVPRRRYGRNSSHFSLSPMPLTLGEEK